MATNITMPKLGLTMSSGSVQSWKKNVGDPIKKGELLFCVATDKLTVDVESPAEGVLLAITVAQGVEVAIGAPIGVIGAAGEKVDAASVASISAAPQKIESLTPITASPSVAQSAASSKGGVPSSPKAKKLAREHGVDIGSVSGTGPNGWVVAKNILSAAQSSKVKTSPVAGKMAAEMGVDLASIQTDKRVMKADVLAAVGALTPATGARRVPITQMRRVIGERMLQSVTSIPAVNYFVDADMSALSQMRVSFNVMLEKKGVKISVNDILMKLCSKLLLENPMMNASVEKDAFLLHGSVNIGFAVALTGGLLVPNVKDVQLKGLAQIAQERAILVDKARNGGLNMDQMSGGTFTISNVGMMGVTSFTPIINPPEAAILGVGATVEKPVVINGQITIRPMATLCLTADHRLVDGADGAKFLAELKKLVEDTSLFLM